MRCKPLLYFFAVAASLCCNGCLEIGAEIVSWHEISKESEPVGSFHQMENAPVKVFIPNEFEEKTIVAFQKIVQQKYPADAVLSEINRINALQDLEGDFSIFYDEETHASITVNAVGFMPLDKQGAKYMLGLFRQDMEKSIKGSAIEIEKIASQYVGTRMDYVFKYVYKFDNPEAGYTNYNHGYVITHNYQTVFINLNAGFNAHFDPYALKTIIQ